MNALNSNEILQKYLIFLWYFTILLSASLLCGFLYLKAGSSYAQALREKQNEAEEFHRKTTFYTARVDSLNNLLSLLSTDLVANQEALERNIIQLKNETLSDIKTEEVSATKDFFLFRIILEDIDQILDTKKNLQQVQEEEKQLTAKLINCNKASTNLRNR